MPRGTRDVAVRTLGTSARSLVPMVILWVLFASLIAWIWQVSWIDPDPFESGYRVNRGRFVSLLGVPLLAVTAWTIGVTGGWIPILWIRRYADGSLAVFTALGRVGFPSKIIRAPRAAALMFTVVEGHRPHRITLPAWNTYFSNGERQIIAITYAPFDETELRAKLDGANEPSSREPY